MAKKTKVKKQGVGKSKNVTQQRVGAENRDRVTSSKEIAPQPNPTITSIPTQPAQTSGIRRTARVLGVVVTFAISLIVFWPRVSLSIVNRDDPMVWLFSVKNDSLLSIWDATTESKVDIVVRPDGVPDDIPALMTITQNDCAPETLPKLRSGDEHTLKCHVLGITSGATVADGNVNLRVKYQYLGFFRPSAVACFKFEQTRKEVAYQWIRRACS